jgi:phage baseplate assembly protein W
MNGNRFRAWRFLLPGIDVPEDAGGLHISATGGIDMVKEDDSVRQAILLLISTVPGERVMRPLYGCYLNRLIFSPNDETTAGLAIHYVRSALERWEPRIDVLRLEAQREVSNLQEWLETRQAPDDSGNVLYIGLLYRVRATQQVRELTIPVNLAGQVS